MFLAAYVSVNLGPSWISLLVWCPLAAITRMIAYILGLRCSILHDTLSSRDCWGS